MIAILLGAGFEEAEALVPADLLRRAGLPVALVGVNGPEITGAHGITVKADLPLDQADPDQIQLLVLPGGMGGVESIQSSPAALALIRQVYDKGKYLSAICAAPAILASLGLLEGKKAVCYPGLESQLAGAVPQPGNRVVTDGRLITGEGPGSAFDFGLALVQLLSGPQTARQVKDSLHYHD